MTEAQLKEAIDVVRRGRNEVTWTEESAKKYREASDLLLNLARSYLSAIKAGVPEEIPLNLLMGKPEAIERAKVYNECRSQMLALIVERDRRIAELEEQINNHK